MMSTPFTVNSVSEWNHLALMHEEKHYSLTPPNQREESETQGMTLLLVQ